MTNTSKVLVDQKGGNNLLYLPLDKLISRSAASPTGCGGCAAGQGAGGGRAFDRMARRARVTHSAAVSGRSGHESISMPS